MSRVVVATAFGGPEVLSVVEEDVVPPGPGQVAIDVRAAGLNFSDLKRYRGDFGRDESKLPLRLGAEAAGVVTAVGEGAVGPAGPVSVGDHVIAYRVLGAYADRIVVDADAVVPKPDAMPWEQASGLLLTGATAMHALAAASVGEGDVVLVHGAAGGVGQMVVQLAVARGARVIGTASPRNHDFVRELGGEPVAYGDGLRDRVSALASRVDAAIDLAGTDEALDVSLDLVADRARIVTIANFTGRPQQEGVKVLGGGPGADPGEELRRRARLELTALAGEGRIRVAVDHAYPLEEVRAAHEALATGHGRGKLVLVP